MTTNTIALEALDRIQEWTSHNTINISREIKIVRTALESSAPPAASEREALTDEREAFEAWLVANGYLADRLPDGDYEAWFSGHAWVGWQARAALHSTGKPDVEVARLREALQFYADGHHFVMHQAEFWDTVSGEPANFYEDEANTATVEDGSVAKAALAGVVLPCTDADLAAPADAPVAEPVAWSYEVGTTVDKHGKYNNWAHQMTRYKPVVPPDSIRNLTPLYTRPPAPEDAKDAARKSLADDEIDRLAWGWGVRNKHHNPASGDVAYRWDFSEQRLRSFVRAALSQGGGA